MRRKLSKLVSPVVAALLLAVLLLSPAVTSGQKKKPGGDGGGNCGACAQRASRACADSEDPRACWQQYFYENCVAVFGCSPQTNPF